MNLLRKPSWSPYAVGAGIGVLSWFAFLTVDAPLGVSSAVARGVAIAGNAVVPAFVISNPYFQQIRPWIGWETLLMVGLILGAFLSARLSGDRPSPREQLSRPWRSLLGGFLIMFGARVAGGCTSGHGISGSLQLALSGWIFFIAVFAGGILAALLLKTKETENV
jgi:hypothetical protein